MKVVFGLQLDHGSWPGLLNNRKAIAGEKWVGINGLIELLDTLLGLRSKHQTFEERQACLVPRLKAQSGFWTESAKVNAWSSASTLLRWRDQLCLWGWSGKSQEGRLRELSQLCGDLSDGIPDRLAGIDQALARRSLARFELDITDKRADLPVAFQRVFDRLEKQGVAINWRSPQPATPQGDLLACGRNPFVPIGDGSLQLVRPFGVLEAADLAASWLSSSEDLESTVIIGAGPALDAALRRFALPTTGAGRAADGTSLLSLLPLVLQLGWLPADPTHAFQLLTQCLSVGPVPRSLSRDLLWALDQWPSVESELWRKKIDSYHPATPLARRFAIA